MSLRRLTAALLAVAMLMGSPALAGAQAPPPPGTTAPTAGDDATTPARISYMHGEVSFWRPGAEDWTPATVNTPLAPGDVLYTGSAGNVEIQIGPRSFVRAAEGTQIGLDNQDPDFIQFRVTSGHAAMDLHEVAPGNAVELDTPNAAFTIERAGYYHVDVAPDGASFRTHRGGSATMTPEGGAPATIGANQQVVVTGTDAPRVSLGPAPELDAWDRWGTQRSDAVAQSMSIRYVGSGVYGAETLDRYGSWRTVDTYGSVWVPSGVAPGWVPYSTGRWIWDPRFGWTWLDTEPWGWAPYHYGRWVFVGSYWAWAPGPVVVRPAYAPALVVFLGGGVAVGVSRPLAWAPLAWGEPVVPWWGRPGFVGRPWWGGWGGPRVVNNVVVNRNTTVNVTNINVYRNVSVNNAVVGVPAERFGHGDARPARIAQTEVQRLTPVRGELGVKPVASSVAPAQGRAARPPEAVHSRPVVATRQPHDTRPALQAEGLPAAPNAAPAPAPRIVPSPRQRGERAAVTQPAQGAPGVPGAAGTPGGPAGQAPAPSAPARPEPRGPEKAREPREQDVQKGPGPAPAQEPQKAREKARDGEGQKGLRARGTERPTPPPPPGATTAPSVATPPQPAPQQPPQPPQPPQQERGRRDDSARPEHRKDRQDGTGTPRPAPPAQTVTPQPPPQPRSQSVTPPPQTVTPQPPPQPRPQSVTPPGAPPQQGPAAQPAPRAERAPQRHERPEAPQKGEKQQPQQQPQQPPPPPPQQQQPPQKGDKQSRMDRPERHMNVQPAVGERPAAPEQRSGRPGHDRPDHR